MRTVRPSATCERVRAQVSLRLDDETSQLERRMLDAHMVRCDECRTFAAEVGRFTNLLRAAPLEPLERAIMIQSPRRIAVDLRQLGLAAAFAIAVVGSVLQLALPSMERSSLPQPSRFPTLAEGANEMQQALADRKAFVRHRSGSTDVI